MAINLRFVLQFVLDLGAPLSHCVDRVGLATGSVYGLRCPRLGHPWRANAQSKHINRKQGGQPARRLADGVCDLHRGGSLPARNSQ